MIKTAYLTSGPVSFTVFGGSDDFGFTKDRTFATLDESYTYQRFNDPVFRRPSKMRKQKWCTRHCHNTKLDGFVSANSAWGKWFMGFDEQGNPIARTSVYILIPLYAPQGAFSWAEGHPFLVPYPEAGTRFCAYAAYPSLPSRQLMSVACAIRGKPGEQSRGWSFSVDVDLLDATTSRAGFGEVFYGSWTDVVSRCRNIVNSGCRVPVEPGAFTPWDTFEASATPFSYDPERVGTAINRALDEAWEEAQNNVRIFQENKRSKGSDVYYDDELFMECAENFRPDMLSYLETAYGTWELPETIQTLVNGVAGLCRKDVPAKIKLITLIGAYLIWCYVIKPTPHDVNIVKRWFKDVLSPYRFSNARMYSRSSFSEKIGSGFFDGWQGWHQACVQLWPLDGHYLPNVGDYLDMVTSDHTLRVADGYGYRENLPSIAETVQALKDLFPLDAGAISEQFWNAIAFSFVVDWFLPVGDWMHRYSNKKYVQTLPVEWACRSTSAVCDASVEVDFRLRKCFEEAGLNLDPTASVWLSQYDRDFLKKVPEVEIFRGESNRPSTWGLQGTALFLQRVLR